MSSALTRKNKMRPPAGMYDNTDGGARRVSSLPSAPGGRRRGKCKFFDCERGYGFIIDAGGLDNSPPISADIEIFIHYSRIRDGPSLAGVEPFKSLQADEEVEYEIINNDAKGYSAQDVTGVSGIPCSCYFQTPPRPRPQRGRMPNMGSPQPSTLPSLPNNALGLGLSANTSPFPNTMNQQQHLSMVLGATTQANPQWPLSYAVPFQQQFPNMNNMNLPLAQNLWQSPGFPMFPNTLPTPHSHGHGFPNTTSPDLAHQQLSQAFVGMDHQVSSYPQNFLMANAGENDEMSGYSSPNPQPNYHESQRQHQHVRQ